MAKQLGANEAERQKKEFLAFMEQTLDAVQATPEAMDFFAWAVKLPASQLVGIYSGLKVVQQHWLPVLEAAWAMYPDQDALDREFATRSAEVRARSRDDVPTSPA